MKKTKLIHCQLLPLLSGVQNVSLSEIEYLQTHYKDEYEFHMITSAHGPLTEACAKLGVKSHIISNLVRDVSVINDIKALKQIYNVFRNVKPDIVHTHSSKPGILGRVAAKLAGTPHVIHTIHGFAFDSSKSLFSKVFYLICEFIAARLCDKLIVMNSSDDQICKQVLRVSHGRVRFVPNGIEAKKYFSKNQRSNIEHKNFINIGFLGRLSNQKNPLILLEAFDAARRMTRQDLKLKFIGDGEMRDAVLKRASDLGLSDCVEISGWTDCPESHLASLDIYVQPSNWEGMPLAILEAAAAGLPIICSDIPGNRDIIQHKKSGLLFKKDDKESLVFALLSLINDEQLRINFSNIARDHIINFYSLSRHGQNVKSIYDDRKI